MKKILVLIFILLFATLCSAADPTIGKIDGITLGTSDGNIGKIDGMVVASGGAAATCTSYEDRTGEDNDGVGVAVGDAVGDAGTYLGQGLYSPAADKTVCQVDVEIGTITGDLSTVDFQVEIHAMTGNNFTATATAAGCTSATKKLTANSTISFTGLSCAITAAGSWAIVVTRTDHGYSNSNYSLLRAKTSAITGFSGHLMRWSAANPPVSDDPYGAYDFSIKIYTN